MAEMTGIEWDWNDLRNLEFLRPGSEKGNRRKHTENWVTRWRNLFWGNFGVLR
jgi:hypothetical protein